MVIALVVLDTLVGIALLGLIFLHSGKDAGLSGTFGGSGSTFGGSGVVQKNLDRLTIACAVLVFVFSIALAYLLKTS
jgi:preprotein translocase subunit SecG